MANDKLKDNFFAENHVPLLRFTAETVRNEPESVVLQIIEAVTVLDREVHTVDGDIPSYSEAFIAEEKAKHLELIQQMGIPDEIESNPDFDAFLSGEPEGEEEPPLYEEPEAAPENFTVNPPDSVQVIVSQRFYDKKHDEYWQSRKEFGTGIISAEDFEKIETAYKKFLDAVASGSIIIQGEE